MKDDKLYLIHILERIERVQTYAARGKEAFLHSQITQDAVTRNFEIIGEAAKRPSVSRLNYGKPIPTCRGNESRAFGMCSSTTTWALTSTRFGASWSKS